MQIDDEKLYTTKEVSGLLGVSEITTKRHITSGKISSVKIGGARRILGSNFSHLLRGGIRGDEKILPKGGCELVYLDKKTESTIFNTIQSSKIRVQKMYGKNPNKELILGDNLGVLRALVDQPAYRGKVDLIYIDPPFGTGQDFIGYNDHSYSDTLTNAKFLEYLRHRLILLRELLNERGSIYVHIDIKIGHYVKVLLDEIFGESNFRNEITRIKCNPKNFERKAFGNIKDVIFFYSKSKTGLKDKLKWTDFRIPLTDEEILRQFPKIDLLGRRYATTPLHAKGETKNGPTGQVWKGLKPPKGRHWRYAPRELTRLDKAGLIEWSLTGNPRKIIYAHENSGRKIQDVWDFKDPGYEKSLYPTEKNIDLLKQIIRASSEKNDLVLDCFCGSGTTLIAAEQLERRWIGIDQNPDAIHATEKRLLDMHSGSLFAKGVAFKISRTT